MVDFDLIRENIRKRKYRLIGSGSGRLVFDLDNGYVAKVAKNRRGVAQNKAEYKIASIKQSDIFAEIVGISADSRCLVMERAERIRSITEVWDYYNVKSNRELFRLDKFKELSEKYNLIYGDLCRKSSWGIINNKPRIIDYGFTKDTRRYYFPF